jgi:hypothetical protein
MLRLPFFSAFALLCVSSVPALAATLSVGPGKPFAKPCEAIGAATAGDTIEVDAAGNYNGDACAWSTDNLTVKGVNGRAKIDDTGATVSQGKGIFVIYAQNATIENFELAGASVGDMNGAGIRHQGLKLTVRNCFFHDNQDGILGGPLEGGMPADGKGEVLVETSEFAHNGAGDGQSHNMYLNHYGKFTLRYSYSHASNVGHLVKSRAVENHILYNRLSDDDSSNVSYEINLPNGGKSYVIGNVVEQGVDPNGQENGAILDFGSEGPAAGSELFVVNNTLVNNRTQGATFVKVNAGVTIASVLRNNVFFGPGTVCDQASAALDHNFTMGDPKLVDAASVDFHLQMGSPCADMGADPGMGDGLPLLPTFQYVHPASFEARASVGTIDIGAYELGGAAMSSGSGGGASMASTSAGTGGSVGAGGSSAVGAGGTTDSSGGQAPSASDSGGCSAAGRTGSSAWLLVATAALSAFCRRRAHPGA